MDKSNSGERDMKEDIRDMRNDIEKIKSDTHNINRIMTLANLPTIITDLKRAVGNSETRVAILHLTSEKITVEELAQKLGINRHGIPKIIAPLTDVKSYIQKLYEDGKMYYRRAEIIDLMNFEEQEVFAPMLESWRAKKLQQTAAPTSSQQESPVVEGAGDSEQVV